MLNTRDLRSVRCRMIQEKIRAISQVSDKSLSSLWRFTTFVFVAYAFSEVATLNGDDFCFQPQQQFGRAYRKDDILMFHITVTEPENIAYLIDLYTYSSRADDGEPPYHLGYHYLLPNLLRKSEGQLELPITCASKHRPLGMMKMEFVKTTPLNDVRCDMKVNDLCAMIVNFCRRCKFFRFPTFATGTRREKDWTLDIAEREHRSKWQVTGRFVKIQSLRWRKPASQARLLWNSMFNFPRTWHR